MSCRQDCTREGRTCYCDARLFDLGPEPFPLDDGMPDAALALGARVIGPPELCHTCTCPGYSSTDRLPPERRAQLFVEAVEQLGLTYGVVFKAPPKHATSPGMYAIDLTCTVVP
jgi:hypothetical protein